MAVTLQSGIIPQNDEQRVQALRRYKILDTPPEESFNTIARLMADCFDVPIALVSLVDKDRVFFKANVGMPGVRYTDREVSLCSFAILSPEPTVFDNPLEEPCLLANPLVHGSFGLRFYAGAPLTTSDGFNIGSVCLVDKKERTFSARQQEMLMRFARLVMNEIELRQAVLKQVEIEEQLQNANKELQFVTDTMPQLVWAAEPDGSSFFFNKGWLEYTGLGFDEVKGHGWIRSLHPEDRERTIAAWNRAVQTGQHYDVEYRLLRYDGVYRWFIARGTPLRDERGAIVKWYGTTTDIQAQKEAEAALRLSEERLRNVLSIETVGVIYFDLEGRIHDGNAAFQRMSGYAAEEIRSGRLRWDQVTPPEYMEATLRSREELLTTGQNTPYEKQYIRPDGSRWWGLFAGRRISDSECVEFVVDITERKKNEELLAQKDRNIRNIIHHAPVAMSVCRGEEMVVEIANKGVLQMLHRTDEIIGKPLFEAFPEMRGQPVVDILYNVYRTGKPYYASEELVPLMRNGVWEDRYINFAYTPVIEDEKITGVMSVATEVTEQVIARKKIEESNRELQFVLDFMPSMVWHTAPDGMADFFNRVYLDYTGQPLHQLTGRQWTNLLHPADVERTTTAWQEALERGEAYSVEHRLRGRDGSYRWFLSRGVPLKNEQGEITKWYGTSTDIQVQKTAAELLERRVEERTRELEMRNRELEEFTYVSHHDLQEPLRKIAMFTDMVRADSQPVLTEASNRRLERVIEASRRMSTALKDVLNFASLNREVQPVEVSLNTTLSTVLSDLELVIAEKNAVIRWGRLPVVCAVPQQMHQLFYNLVNNALKFSRPGLAPEVEISCRSLNAETVTQHPELNSTKKYVEITLKDNGIGFSQHQAEKIFVMFQRLHTKEAYAGTGIGLALCKKVVTNHKGKIWAESAPGEGATFRIILPEQ